MGFWGQRENACEGSENSWQARIAGAAHRASGALGSAGGAGAVDGAGALGSAGEPGEPGAAGAVDGMILIFGIGVGIAGASGEVGGGPPSSTIERGARP